MKRFWCRHLFLFAILLLCAVVVSVWYWSASLKDVKPFEALPKSEQIASLIDRLVVTEIAGNPKNEKMLFGMPMFPETGRGTTPASQLLEMGLDTVPQLISVLDDKRETPYRYTLSAGSTMRITHATVGDCALEILRKLSGRNFVQRRASKYSLEEEEWTSNAKMTATAWWNELQNKGEELTLQNGVVSANADSPSQAKLLMIKYPKSALNTLITGVRSSKDNWISTRLVGIAAQLPDEQTISFLREMLLHTDRNTRVVAAAGMLAKGNEEGLLRMIQEWRDAKVVKATRDEYDLLVDFLTGAGRVNAIKALGQGIHDWPVEIQSRIIWSLGDEWPGGWSTSSLKDDISWPFAVSRKLPDVLNASNELLVSLLNNDEAFSHLFSYNGTFNPRVGDLSAEVLSKRLFHKDWFSMHGTLRARDRQRMELQNQWLKLQGKALKQIPNTLQAPRHVDNQQYRALLNIMIEGKTQKERLDAGNSLLTFGIPALPAVRSRLDSLSPKHLAFDELQKLAHQMSCTVREVRITNGSSTVPDSLKDRFSTLTIKPFDAVLLIDAVFSALQTLPTGVTGLRVTIDREGDDTGVLVIIMLTTKNSQTSSTHKGWNTVECFRVGSKWVHNRGGGFSVEACQLRMSWQSLANRLQNCIDSAPSNEYLFLQFSCIIEADR